MTVLLIGLVLVLLALLVFRRRTKVRIANTEWLASIDPIDQKTIDELEDYRRNVMRLYLADGTKLTVCKAKLIARQKI